MADTLNLQDDRATAILDAVKYAFAEKGFDGASMQDLARAAGMSAGNFYRYFQSKDAIIEAIIARDQASLKMTFLQIISSADPTEMLIRAFDERLNTMDCNEGPLWAEVDAAASRKPEIARLVRAMEAEVSGFLTGVMGRITGLSVAEADERYKAQAYFLILMFKATAQRLHGRGCHIPEDARSEVRQLVISTVRKIISDIAADRPEKMS